MRTAIVLVAIFLIVVLMAFDGFLSAAMGRTLTWEAWEENAAVGSASEGAHVWVTHGLYERARDLGMGKWEAAGSAMGTMLVWEVFEVRGMDAKGVSVQDLAANSVGVIAGLSGIGLHFSYASYSDPPERDDKVWLNLPGIPLNDMTYALELAHDGWALGFKYMAEPGDLVIGSTTMPVHAGEHGGFTAIPYVGYEWRSGWHMAAGYDRPSEEVMAGGGYRIAPFGLGIDLTGLLHGDDLTFGASLFVEFESIL
ncbi:hypothetical protein K8S17_00905 [bacterium]|nr:hypothetical protein [bacterium]